MPIGRDRAFLSTLPTVVDYAIGGWQYTAAMRYYSGGPLFFGNFVVNGDPTLDEPARDRWFGTSRFSVQDTFAPRSNPSFYQVQRSTSRGRNYGRAGRSMLNIGRRTGSIL